MNNGTIFDWIEASTVFDDQHIIRENQSGNRPEPPYISYDFLSLVPADHSTPQKKIDPGDPDRILTTYYNRARLAISVNVYDLPDGSPELVLEDLNLSTCLLAPRLILRDGNLALIGMGTIRNLSLLGDTTFRRRFQADFEFLYFSTVAESVQRIYEMSIGGKWKHAIDEDPADSLPVVVNEGITP